MTREPIAAVYDNVINDYVYTLEIVNGYHVIAVDMNNKIRKADIADAVYVLQEYAREKQREKRALQPYRPEQ